MYYGLLSLAGKVAGSSYDADAQAFFTAAGITDTTQKSAVNQLVLDLKSYSLWTLGKYMYLGFLGDSNKCKYNLFNPSQTLTFYGGWTFDSSGMLGNGINSYAKTGFIPSGNTNKDSQSFGIYSQSNIDELTCDMGSVDYGIRSHLFTRSSNSAYVQLATSAYYTVSVTDSKGYFLISRNSSSSFTMYRNNSQIFNDIGSNITVDVPLEDYLGAWNNSNSAGYYSNRKISSYFRFTGLTSTESNNVYSSIQTMMTTLGIQV